MAKNYNKKSNSASKRSDQQSSDSFVIFIFGFILGIVACQLLPYLLKSKNHQAVNENHAVETDALAKPDFQFPTLLKGRESDVSQTEAKSQTTSETLTNGSYLLQVGSFKNADDADSLKAKLIINGMPAFIEAFKTSSGDELHRVLVGPFSNSQESSNAKIKLIEINLDSLLLKRNNS